MAFEIVKQISDIEREGEELVKSARSRALEIQKSSKEEADNIIEKAKLDAQEYYTKVVDKFESEGYEASKPVLEVGNQVKDKITNISPGVIGKAVNLIIERIVKSHGNS